MLSQLRRDIFSPFFVTKGLMRVPPNIHGKGQLSSIAHGLLVFRIFSTCANLILAIDKIIYTQQADMHGRQSLLTH